MKSNTASFYIAVQNALHSEDARELSRVQREFIQAYSLVKIVVGFCNDGKGFKPVLCFLKPFLYIFLKCSFSSCSGGRMASPESYLFINECKRSNRSRQTLELSGDRVSPSPHASESLGKVILAQRKKKL